MSHINLLFPQWQGSGRTKDLYYGAQHIKEKYLSGITFEEISVCDNDSLIIENDILGFREILKQWKDVSGLINRLKPNTMFTIGGGGGVEITPVLYLNKRYNGNLAVMECR